MTIAQMLLSPTVEHLSTKARVAGVYLIVCVVNRRGYVGSSRDVYRRWHAGHRAKLRRGAHACAPLQAAWDKYGPGAFQMVVLERAPDDATAQYLLDRENAWLVPAAAIDRRQVYNVTVPAVLGREHGFTHSDEARRKISAGNKGHTRNRGRKMSAATRAKMSAAHRGKPAWNAGKQPSAATRLRMSEAQRGEGNGRAKLTNEAVLAIYALRSGSESSAAVALRFGVEASAVNRIWQRRTWRHLLGD